MDMTEPIDEPDAFFVPNVQGDEWELIIRFDGKYIHTCAGGMIALVAKDDGDDTIGL